MVGVGWVTLKKHLSVSFVFGGRGDVAPILDEVNNAVIERDIGVANN